MTDNRKVVPIAYCECCGMRPSIGPLLGVYTPGAGWYCIRCEQAILRPSHDLTPEAVAFVKRLAVTADA